MEKFFKVIIGVLIGVIGVYCIISVSQLLPYLILFMEGQYIVELHDLPTYSDVFNSIFGGINIIITSILSWLIYSLYCVQEKRRVRADANLVYNELKMHFIFAFVQLIKENMDKIEDKDYLAKGGMMSAKGFFNEKWNKSYCTYNIDDFNKAMITLQNDFEAVKLSEIKSKIGKESYNRIIKSKTLPRDLLLDYNTLRIDLCGLEGKNSVDLAYVLGDIIKVTKKENELKIVINELDSAKLLYMIYDMLDDKWGSLTDRHQIIMGKLFLLTGTKKKRAVT